MQVEDTIHSLIADLPISFLRKYIEIKTGTIIETVMGKYKIVWVNITTAEPYVKLQVLEFNSNIF